MPRNDSLSQRLAKVEPDSREYQQLKVAHDTEVDATARYREQLKKKHGEQGAEAIMRKKGYDPDILKR